MYKCYNVSIFIQLTITVGYWFFVLRELRRISMKLLNIQLNRLIRGKAIKQHYIISHRYDILSREIENRKNKYQHEFISSLTVLWRKKIVITSFTSRKNKTGPETARIRSVKTNLRKRIFYIFLFLSHRRLLFKLKTLLYLLLLNSIKTIMIAKYRCHLYRPLYSSTVNYIKFVF